MLFCLLLRTLKQNGLRAVGAWLSCAAVLPDASSYRDVCVALRQEHDREVAISQQLMVGFGQSPFLLC